MMLGQVNADNNYLHRIIFTDEAAFHTSGVVNCHNCRFGAVGTRMPCLWRPKTCGVVSCQTTLSGLSSSLRTLSPAQFTPELCVSPDGWSRQPHFPTGWHSTTFWCHCMHCSRCPVLWSMNRQGRANLMTSMESWLNTHGFFFWGFVKNIIYRENVQCVADLRWWITAAITAIPLDTPARMWTEMEYCYNVFRAVNGAHIELHWITLRIDEFPW
jgi:hypothetical protein